MATFVEQGSASTTDLSRPSTAPCVSPHRSKFLSLQILPHQDSEHLQKRSLQTFIFEADQRLKQLQLSNAHPNDTLQTDIENGQSVAKNPPPKRYHVLEKRQKKILVGIISLVAILSPLSSNIYLPATTQIANDLNVSITSVLLTITVYMVVQGLAPSFWGALADSVGRRQAIIGTLAVYEVANLGLALAPNFAALMMFRGFQALGSSATISIGSGIIADIAPRAERGGYIGTFSGVRMLGQSVGPVIGGVLTEFLGFRSIFYFLFIFGALVMVTVILVLPETLRAIAEDGSVKLSGVRYRPVLSVLTNEQPSQTAIDPKTRTKKLTWKAIAAPVKSLLEKDIFITLFFGSIVYAVWSMMTASTTNLFKTAYDLSNLVLGLSFIPNGLGCVIGSLVTGRLLDHDYKKVEKRYRKQKDIPRAPHPLSKQELIDFPIEKARQRNLWWIVAIFIGIVAAFGYSLQTDIDLPLLLQFLISFTATSIFNINSTLLLDLFPSSSSASATALNNLMRCTVGAIGVVLVEPLIESLGSKLTFVVLAAVTAGVVVPGVVVEMVWGARWRRRRGRRMVEEEGGSRG